MNDLKGEKEAPIEVPHSHEQPVFLDGGIDNVYARKCDLSMWLFDIKFSYHWQRSAVNDCMQNEYVEQSISVPCWLTIARPGLVLDVISYNSSYSLDLVGSPTVRSLIYSFDHHHPNEASRPLATRSSRRTSSSATRTSANPCWIRHPRALCWPYSRRHHMGLIGRSHWQAAILQCDVLIPCPYVSGLT